MRWGTALAAVLVLLAPAWCDEGHQHTLTEAEIGSVRFPTSCSAALSPDFNRAVALLHSFQYEQAREAFNAISKKDPSCAMAEWGVAMSHYHGLWGNGDAAAGRQAIRKAQQLAAENSKTSGREKGYIEALAEIYREDGKDDAVHAQAFEQKMASLQASHPEDHEAAIFRALALYITAAKTDKTFSNQRKCGEILEPLFQQQPNHPGLAHYLIHCYDNPVLAERALPAARVYARIAPASAHANHMPSHIFTRVGSWDESIASNTRSAELAARDEARSTNGEARDQRLHAMDYQEYAFLQTGRVKQAKAVLDDMNSLPNASSLTRTGNYALAAIAARLAMELGSWQQASELQPRTEGILWAQAITWMAIGVGSARSGELERANQAEHKLSELRDAIAQQGNVYWSKQVEVQRLEVAAWIAQKSEGGADDLNLMRSAAELEESMDKDAVTPGPVIPAREMLAEMLLLQKQPQQSLESYRAVLKVAPNRFNALYGAAIAAEAASNRPVAQQYFEQLTRIAVGEERPELLTARKKLAVMAKSAPK